MKRLSKILVALLALCLMVGALALAISANSGIDGKFVVKGKGYETWEEALAAADNTHTIYLNEDWAPEGAITVSGATTKIKLDLNGKVITVASGVDAAFVVNTGASLTITGEGTINNALTVVKSYGAATISVDGTKSGIVINHRAVANEKDAISAFKSYDSSIVNVSGALTVNAPIGSRRVFDVYPNGSTPGAKELNIINAKISVPLPTQTPANDASWSVTWLMSIGDNIDIEILDSDLEIYYGQIMHIEGAGATKSVSAYKNSSADYTWKDGAAKGVSMDAATVRINAKNTRFFSDYGEFSKKMAASGHNIGAGIMAINAKAYASFDNCNFYADWRPFTSSATITSNNINQHQLLFTDCNFFNSPGANTTSQYFIYGINYKILGGTFSASGSIAAGSNYYLALLDQNGNPTGKWVGGYMNNTLLSAGKTFYSTSGVTGGWVDATYVEEGSKQDCNITLSIDGASYTFKAAYFTDLEKLEALSSGAGAAKPYEKYFHAIATGNNVKATGDYIKDGSSAAVGTMPFYNDLGTNATAYGSNFNAGYATSVLSSDGNGYIRYSFAKDDTSQNGSSNYAYIQTPTGAAGSIVTNDAFVLEWDISTDDGAFTGVTFTSQGRQKHPAFNANGEYLGLMNSTGAKNAFTYGPSKQISFNGSKLYFGDADITLSTVQGDWTRLTLIIDVEVSELKEVDFPTYTDDGSKYVATGGTVKKMAYEVLKYDLILYANGTYVDTIIVNPKECALNGYIAQGYEANYYIDGVRISHKGTANRADSWCIDNVRSSYYPNSANVDLGYYGADGKPVASIKGLEHFLIMPDNMKTNSPVAEVDGVEFLEEEKAIAAIKDGSVVKLLSDFGTVINKSGISYKVYPNGFEFAGVASSTHKLVDYVGGLGYYKLVAASESELYTVSYTYSGVTKYQTIAMGTVAPALEDRFPGVLNGNVANQISYWIVSDEASDYYLSTNEIVATPVTEEVIANFEVDGFYYDNFAEAFANATGETLVFRTDLVVDAGSAKATTYKTASATVVSGASVGLNVSDDVTLDFNGHKLTQNFEGVLFNVTSGTLTLKGEATFDNVGTFARATGSNSKIIVDATGDGFVINEDGKSYNVFVAESKASFEINGTVDIYSAYATIIFKLTGADSASFNNASVISYGPSAEIGYKPSDFFVIGDGNTISIESSTIRVNCGDMFQVSTSAITNKAFNISGYLASGYLYADASKLDADGKIKDLYFPEFTINVTANDSTIIAALGDPQQANQTYVGGLFRVDDAAINVEMTNCELQGNSRVFQGGSRPNNTKKVSPNQFTFVDVNYSTVDKDKTDSPNLFQENINVFWNGGTITVDGHFVGCAFAPMKAQNGVIGVNLYNTNRSSSKEFSPGDAYHWDKAPGTNAWTRYWSAEKVCVAIVDNLPYATEADAIAAIKDGSKVVIMRSFETDVMAIANACTIDTLNGYYSVPLFISETHKVVLDNENVNIVAAAENEIFTITYTFGDKTKTQTAALGTIMVAPTGFDAYIADEVTKKFTFLKGWALVEDADVIIVTESTNATAIVDYVDPVIVYWTDASGENILDTDYYFPGEKTVLDAYNGINIDVDHTPDYYSYGRQGWAGIEEATAGLATPGEYYITAIMGKIAPDTFPGLKYSLSLYSNFVMNFYVPSDIEEVSNLVISTNADGSSLISEFAPEAIDGVTYDKYGYMLGVADTEIKTFYIVYNVGDDRLSFPVSVGVPTYAASVMEEYSEDNSSAGVALKTLVVNMANYAVKVLKLNGSDMNSDGAKIYNEIINANADYLSYYNSLTNEKFLADGEFYNKHGVASLNYVSRDDESNSEALSYIKSIGFNFNTFEPAFIIKFSDAALAEGLQAPTANGSTEYFKAGLRVYAGTSRQFAAKVWAEKDGNKYYGLADIWASVNADGEYDNNCSSEYEYFAMAVGSDDNASVEWYKDNNVREDLKIKIYMSENDSTAEIVGEVNYNLAAYINAMLKDAEGNADYIEAAKAIYAYSYVSEYYGLVK